jgi:hypothetical protein
MKRVLILVGLTMGVLNLQAQITAGPSGMPSSTAGSLEYNWQETGHNFEITNPATAENAGAPATDVTTTTGSVQVTKHFEAVPYRLIPKPISPDATAARGGAYQYSYSLSDKNSTYNHDGLAFEDLNSKLETAALAHADEIKKAYQNLEHNMPFDFALQPDLTAYHKNIKSGKWHKFVNGEVCNYIALN